jgi:copper(I)-binding protein
MISSICQSIAPHAPSGADGPEEGTAVTRTARLPRRVLAPAGLALFAAMTLAVSGCAAGQYSQTADQVAAIDGANGTVGDITVLNARLAPTEREDYPAGANARVLLYISNNGLDADTLESVTTSAANSVRITGDATLPPQKLSDFASDSSGTEVIVTGFVQDQPYGVSIPMTFSFANAGTVDLNVPIQLPAERSTNRETVNILPPHPTPLWEEDELAEGDVLPNGH